MVCEMVEGARCWADEAQKTGFSSAEVQITYMLAWYAKFLAILHICSAQCEGTDLFDVCTRVKECGQTRSRPVVLLHIEDNQSIDAPAREFRSVPTASVLKTQTL